MLQNFAPAAHAAPIAVRAELTMPFPAWEVSFPFEREQADKLAWRNDHESNDDENYPGFGWDEADTDDFEPTPQDIAELNGGVALGAYLSPDAQDALLDFAAWERERAAELEEVLAELHSPFGRLHPAELAEAGLDPWGHRLPAAVASDCYRGGDWR